MQVRHGRLPSAVAPESTYPTEPTSSPLAVIRDTIGWPGDWEPVLEILGRFDGRNGQITIAQERKTGARLYVEEGVKPYRGDQTGYNQDMRSSGEASCERRQGCCQHRPRLGSAHYPRADCGQTFQ
jgi:hypothetical protein